MDFKFKYKKYAEALYHSLREDAFYITMENSVTGKNSSKEAMLMYMEYSIIEAEKNGILYIPENHHYGLSVWTKSISQELECKKNQEKKVFLLNKMGEKSLKTYNAIVEFMSTKAEAFVDKHFWYLSIIGILPEYQGQGFGPGLIKNVLKKTDSNKIPTYLETFTPRNMSFYKRLGYKEIKSFYEPTTKSDYCLMIREPSFA